jgi:hypothetical protein
MLPFVSFNAFLQSIIPAPVISRSSFTIAAVIAIYLSSIYDFYSIINEVLFAKLELR